MKVLVEFSDEELGRLIDYLIIHRNNISKIGSQKAVTEVSEMIGKLQNCIIL